MIAAGPVSEDRVVRDSHFFSLLKCGIDVFRLKQRALHYLPEALAQPVLHSDGILLKQLNQPKSIGFRPVEQLSHGGCATHPLAHRLNRLR